MATAVPLLDRVTARELAAGSLSSTRAVTRALAQIESSELQAFAHIRGEAAVAEAQAQDAENRRPWRDGELRGLPFAVKDTIDTIDLPTEHNSPLYLGHQPSRDAACVELLRRAGAILVGKTSTVEFASLGTHPATRNPYDPQRSPGGSSSGSGAAVGGGLVTLALGTQTGGSTIRPASFCGAVGFKPTYGRVSFEGAKPYAPSLDTLGWLTSTVELAARVGRVLGAGFGDPMSRPTKRQLRLGLYRTRYWPEAETETRQSLDVMVERCREAGHTVEVVADPCAGHDLNRLQDIVMHGEGRQAFFAESRRDPERLHPAFHEEVNNVRGITPSQLVEAYDLIAQNRSLFDRALTDFDAWLTPATPGVATRLADGNGLATFNRLFTALGVPCVSLPFFDLECPLPIGVQLVSGRYRDEELLSVARRLEDWGPI